MPSTAVIWGVIAKDLSPLFNSLYLWGVLLYQRSNPPLQIWQHCIRWHSGVNIFCIMLKLWILEYYFEILENFGNFLFGEKIRKNIPIKILKNFKNSKQNSSLPLLLANIGTFLFRDNCVLCKKSNRFHIN